MDCVWKRAATMTSADALASVFNCSQQLQAWLVCLPVPSPLFPHRRRLSYCRLPDEHVTGDELQQLTAPHAHNGSGRQVYRTVERVPVRQPGRRRPSSFYHAWWQPVVQARLAAAAAEAAGGPPGAVAGAAAAAAGDRAHRYLAEREEVGGWAAIRPGNHRTHDVLVRLRRA